MEDDLKAQRDALAVATWTSQLALKDQVAARKLMTEKAASDSKSTNAAQKELRVQKLAALFRRDEVTYEEELNRRGLAFRRPEY